ncbi:MAG: hypothetical protein Q8Q88_14440 [Phenylobacterium sp.]|uniref:hypothetical protein n=1 Tax=Phenylobacterium sp. TaxID=1871053 RepID=UPI00273730B4|nr:hypothetical protein [Phenylobacterium sp.]MDP3748235.1 hypothetical protein [Phenylobacterium sp.]
MWKTFCGLALAGLLASACDDPATHPPEVYVPPIPAPPTDVALVALRGALGPCEAAMDEAADPIGQLAAGGRASTEGRAAIERARLICGGATAEIRALGVWGRLKDPCAQAAQAREVVATGALDILELRGSKLGVPALRDKIADQAAVSRACAGEIVVAERQSPTG